MSRGLRDAARLGARVLFTAGALALGYVAYVSIDARLYQARERRRFEADRRPVAIAAVSPTPAAVVAPPPADGTTIGEIRIARLRLSAVIAQGESEPILQRAVGHLARTALPGAEGNVVLAGHRDTFFRPLKGIRDGDRITLSTRDRDIEYVVEWTSVVKPTDVQVIEPTGGHTLTLVTCFPFYYVGAAPNRFIVFARETSNF
ncbi:MAG TPA: class D sortase [Vicinamibacterales bacterium]|nr:class D sortase [Vicinamibacterales bacterium]